MKTNKTIILVLTFIVSISFVSCVEDANYTMPKSLGIEENATLNSVLDSIAKGTLQLKTIQQVKDLYISGKAPLKVVSNIVVKGYVVSSDKTGNFFKEFYMQDTPENPTAGIKVAVNLKDSYNRFNIGREVYVRLKSLYLGETNSGDGITSIGGKIKYTDVKELEGVMANQIPNHIYRSKKTAKIVPKVLTLATINETNIGMFVKVEKAFFPTELIGKPYVNPEEDYDTQRKIQAFQSLGFQDLLVETSSFASFANKSLPKGGGSISAVVSKDFNGNSFVLAVNTTDDIKMNGKRYTSPSIDEYSEILLEEDFEGTSRDISITDWTNYKQAGSRTWKSYTDRDSSSKAAKISSYRSGDASTISWLITKGINLDATSQEFLSFETSNSSADGSKLEVLISTNWDGTTDNISSATWEVLPAKIVSDSENYKKWIHSTYIDLSNYSGTAYIAFKYTGDGSTAFDGTYELDNIRINAKS